MTSAFFDTNIILYLNDLDAEKSARAAQLIFEGGVISAQVLNEYCSVARKRGKRSWSEIEEACLTLCETLAVTSLTLESQTSARAIAQRYGFTIYDTNIIASAKLAGCGIVWTEDMQHGQIVEGVKLLNPFLGNA